MARTIFQVFAFVGYAIVFPSLTIFLNLLSRKTIKTPGPWTQVITFGSYALALLLPFSFSVLAGRKGFLSLAWAFRGLAMGALAAFIYVQVKQTSSGLNADLITFIALAIVGIIVTSFLFFKFGWQVGVLSAGSLIVGALYGYFIATIRFVS